jgi:hypothetical protein
MEMSPGDSLISSPENFFDLAGVYPLKMMVVGILHESNSPDDNAISALIALVLYYFTGYFVEDFIHYYIL